METVRNSHHLSLHFFPIKSFHLANKGLTGVKNKSLQFLSVQIQIEKGNEDPYSLVKWKILQEFLEYYILYQNFVTKYWYKNQILFLPNAQIPRTQEMTQNISKL